MKYTIMTAAAIFAAFTTAAMADAPAGATACDSTAFVPVLTKSGAVAYWNNPTCPASGGAGQSLAAVDPCAPTVGASGRKG